MRPLTDEEIEKLFSKLVRYIGDNVKQLLERADGAYCFRFHRDRVYYCNEKLMKQAACIARKELLSFGTCIGRFTKGGNFLMGITALDYLAPYAKGRIWLKPNAEQQFLYGSNILKSGVGRMTDGIEAKQIIPLPLEMTLELIISLVLDESQPKSRLVCCINMRYRLMRLARPGQHRRVSPTLCDVGVVVYNMSDVPLGFGVASKGTAECKRSDPTTLVVLHQSDLGEYIRTEDALT